MSSTLRSVRKILLRKTPFKETTFKLNCVLTQVSQQTKPAAFPAASWVLYGASRDPHKQVCFYPGKGRLSEKTNYGRSLSQKLPVLGHKYTAGEENVAN